MVALLVIVAVFSAMHDLPQPRGQLSGPSHVHDIRMEAEPPAPSGPPWQQVIAPYVHTRPGPSGWAR